MPELANVMNEVSARVLFNESFDVVNEPVPGTAVLEVCSKEQSDALSQSSSQLISTDVNEPYQPSLESSNPKQYPVESSKRDFNPVLYETFLWLSLNKSSKSFECFPCQKFYPARKSFLFSNWRKSKNYIKHCKSKSHQAAMKKWINLKINLKQQSSVSSKVHYEEEVKKNREYLQIIVETLIFTAVQNIPQRNNALGFVVTAAK